MRKKKSEIITEFIASLCEKENHKSLGEQWKQKRFSEKGYTFWADTAFPVRIYCELPKELTNIEKGRCLECTQWLEVGTNMLYYRSNNIHKPLTIRSLAKRLNISERQCQRFIKRMLETRVIAREQGKLFMNPCYFVRGKYLNYHLYQLFKRELDQVLPQWVVARYEAMV